MTADRACPAPTAPGWSNAAFACAAGLYFSLLQFSYFFLLEAFLSSQAPAYFVALFFWLCGFLIGLNLARRARSWRAMLALLGLSLLAYYLAYSAIRSMPFNMSLLPLVGACLLLSGLAPGFFFTFGSERFGKVKKLLFHENNGFVLGILLSMAAAIYAGQLLMRWGPLSGGLLAMALLGSARRAQERHPGDQGTRR